MLRRQTAADLIAESENTPLALGKQTRSLPYRDAGGWAIGFGHQISEKQARELAKTGISRDQAYRYLHDDMKSAATEVDRQVKVPLNPGQRDALISWTYNFGGGNLAESTLLKKVNAGDHAGASKEFGRWIYSQGQQLPGLIARRAKESAMYLPPVPKVKPSMTLDSLLASNEQQAPQMSPLDLLLSGRGHV